MTLTTRRSFLSFLAAPAIVRASSLMPISAAKLFLPEPARVQSGFVGYGGGFTFSDISSWQFIEDEIVTCNFTVEEWRKLNHGYP